MPSTTGEPGRRRTTLAVRVVLLVVAVAATVAAIAGAVGVAMIRSTATDVSRNVLASQADVLQTQIEDADPGFRLTTSKLTQVLQQQGVAVVQIGPAGHYNSSDQRAVTAAQQADSASLVGGTDRRSRTVTVAGRTLLVEARGVGARAFALVAAPGDVGTGAQRTLIRRVLIALSIGLGVAVVAGLVLAGLLSRSLRRTAATARAMGEGRRDLRAPVGGPKEVAEVATAVNELAAALQDSENRQKRFLTSVSHELRTPLTGITGQADALADGIVPADETPQVGRVIAAEAARLQRLVSDLLDLARLGADTFRLEPAPCDLTALLAEMAVVWQVRCDARGVQLRVERPAGPLVVVTDHRRLRQVLDGLAENALRLLGPGAPLVLSATVGTGAAVVQVRDGGPGLAPEDYPVAFEQGVLHERYRGRRPGGAGLGLALAASLVSRMGGTITAAPAAEGGVAMTITLPLPDLGGLSVPGGMMPR
jgi:two-component system, OmpR family, sensor kinase